MNAPRRSTVITNAPAAPLEGWMGVLRGQLNNIFTGILVLAAVAMFVRWRIKTAEVNKQVLGTELANATRMIEQLKQKPNIGASPADWIKNVETEETAADAAISNLLNSSDATAATRARAYILRGDLYWNLANLPALAGADTEPTLRLSQSSDALLQKSFDAYSEVVKNSMYADQHEILNDAHLGLAAIAENRGDWETARTEFQSVVDDKNAMPILGQIAQNEIDRIPVLKKKLYIAPPSGLRPATAPTDTGLLGSGLLGPIGPMPALQLPATAPTRPTSMPVMMPATH